MGSKSKRPFVQTNPLRKRKGELRQEFSDRFNANPCNFIPAPVLHDLYRTCVKTKDLNAAAAQWLNDNPQAGWRS